MVHIPIVMATDNRYIPLIVSIVSMVESAAEDTFYDICVLIDDSFAKESENTVKKCMQIFTNRCTLSFKNIGHVFDYASTNIPHITRPTYYRLIISELLREDKCIYLDTDTIVLSDLQALYHTSLKNYYIAGVWHPGVILDDWEEGLLQTTNLPDADQYINAGVLVMNLKKMRSDGVTERFLKKIPEDMPNQDQDIINCVCYGQIELIPFKYNVMTKIADRRIEDYMGRYSETELREAWNNPCIIHYASPNKPWNSGDCVFMDYWWNFFRKAPIYSEVMNHFTIELVTNIIYGQQNHFFTKKLPEIFDIAFEREYVIYGAGKRAMDVIAYMNQRGIYPKFIVVSDLKDNPSEVEGIEVKDIKEAAEQLKNKAIVIAVRESWQKEIIRMLYKYDYLELLPISDKF